MGLFLVLLLEAAVGTKYVAAMQIRCYGLGATLAAGAGPNAVEAQGLGLSRDVIG